jgi:H+/Cl- antiporter ClcA
MSLRRLRTGELIALGGLVCVIVSLFEPWYRSANGNLDAWNTFGPTIVLLTLAAVAGLVLVASALTERTAALPVGSAVWAVLFGFLATIAAVVRVLERPDHATSLCVGPWLALVGAVAIFAGAWETLRDERPSMYEPATPAPRQPPSV